MTTRMENSNQMNPKEIGKSRTHYLNQETGEGWNRSFPNGFSLWEPTGEKPVTPEVQPFVLVLPHGERERIDLA